MNLEKSRQQNNNNLQNARESFHHNIGKLMTDIDVNLDTRKFDNIHQEGYNVNNGYNQFINSENDYENSERINYLKSIIDKAPKLHLEVYIIYFK